MIDYATFTPKLSWKWGTFCVGMFPLSHISFYHYLRNVVLGILTSFFQLDHQIDINLYLVEAIALCRFMEVHSKLRNHAHYGNQRARDIKEFVMLPWMCDNLIKENERTMWHHEITQNHHYINDNNKMMTAWCMRVCGLNYLVVYTIVKTHDRWERNMTNKEWDLNWEHPFSWFQDIREAMTLRKLILQSLLECSWFETILMYFHAEATHAQNFRFAHKYRLGQERWNRMCWNSGPHNMCKWAAVFITLVTPDLTYDYFTKKIKISISNVQYPMIHSYWLPKRQAVFSPHPWGVHSTLCLRITWVHDPF